VGVVDLQQMRRHRSPAHALVKPSESRMREIRKSGSMSGGGKATAPAADSSPEAANRAGAHQRSSPPEMGEAASHHSSGWQSHLWLMQSQTWVVLSDSLQ
jgi:hypothetical protein